MIKKADEKCPWCGKKALGIDETNFISCVKCDYHSDYKKRIIDIHDRINKSMKIYDTLVCCESNEEVRFCCICNKLKGHSGEHKDSDHPDIGWD